MTTRYLTLASSRTQRLKRVLALMDVEHGFTERDEVLWQTAMDYKIPLQIILTKCDTVRPWKLHRTMEQIVSLAEQVNSSEIARQQEQRKKVLARRMHQARKMQEEALGGGPDEDDDPSSTRRGVTGAGPAKQGGRGRHHELDSRQLEQLALVEDDTPFVPVYPYVHAISAKEDIGMQELRVTLAAIGRDAELTEKAGMMMEL